MTSVETRVFEFSRPTKDQEPPQLEEMLKAIPKEYFQKSTLNSIRYFVQDVVIISCLYSLLYFYKNVFDSFPILYLVIWFALGTMFWALFVIGHDCGHRSFSDSILICDIFGHITHTLILVPFHPWRLSHQKHHKNTGNVRKDESFVALPERIYRTMFGFLKLVRFYTYPFFGFTLYLIGGMPIHYYSHLIPIGVNYNSMSKKFHSLISILAVFGMLYFLRELYRTYGLNFLITFYIAPYSVFIAWISIVTFLHHTHPDVPWYRGDEWNFAKGAMSTVDRDYGIFEEIHHNIGTHIVHHLCSTIPHYNLRGANKHLIPVLGPYYKKSKFSTWESMKMAYEYCRFVPNNGGVLYFEQNWREVLKSPMKSFDPEK